MFEKLLAERIKGISPYLPEDGSGMTALDKNESPFEAEEAVKAVILERLREIPLNRYPDNDCKALKKAIAAYSGVSDEDIVAGNGSDELIHVVMQAFVEPGDKIMLHSPTFSMYGFYAALCGGQVVSYDTGSGFKIEEETFLDRIRRENPKLLILCNPNNPTGGVLGLIQVEAMLACFNGMLLVDEAYYEYSGITAQGLALKNDRVIVLRTLSKGMGLAGLRIGYSISCPAVAAYLERARPPFNINALSQAAAIAVMENAASFLSGIESVKAERARMTERLARLKGVVCYPSAANFILIRVSNPDEVLDKLEKQRIRVKSFGSPALRDCLRITIGTPEENNRLCSLFEEVYDEQCG